MRKHLPLAIVLSAAMLVPAPFDVSAASAPTPNPVISRNCPAYAGSNPATAAAGNDDYYYSFWNAQCPDYLAYDLSGVPAKNREVIDAVWYCTSAYDTIGMYQNRNMEPSDYTIEVNAAPGGAYPETGWEVVETVEGNTLASRQHVVEFQGYNWIRMSVTGADDKPDGTANINLDIHDVSQGVSDSWLFLGDSITAGGMNNCFGTGFATYVNELDKTYFPIQENGGIGGITSTDGRANIDRWLSTFPGQYVSIAYGTNDAWGNQSGTQKYYENTVYMIETVLALGKTPVLPKIPHSTNSGVADHLDAYNAMIDRIYEEYPAVVQGPDFDAFFEAHPEYLSADGVHPESEGYDQMRRLWASTMYERVYASKETAPENVLRGDVDGNGVFELTDLITLQKHILGQAALNAPDNADLNGDSIVDVFDLAIMKRDILR